MQYIMNSIKQMFPCKKVRRSSRLECKQREKYFLASKPSGPLGYFNLLPVELQFHVLSFLSVEELSLVSILSKTTRNLVEAYRKSACGVKHVLPVKHIHQHFVLPASTSKLSENQTAFIEYFHKLGLLMKRSTCLYNTGLRLKIINEYMSQLMCTCVRDCERPFSCFSLLACGTYLHTVIAGWDDMECKKVFDFIYNTTQVCKQTEKAISGRPGFLSELEMNTRLFFRRVFIDVLRRAEDKSFWLDTILKPWPMVTQARLLFLLFGPLSAGEIEWHEMCETTPNNADRAYRRYGALADALRMLHCFRWTEDSVISVIDEITSLPEDWLPENTAHLLLLCGDNITVKLLGSKAINGRIQEISIIVAALAVACYKNRCSISWVVGVIQRVCIYLDSQKDRLSFLTGVIDTFRENILELHEFSDPDQDPELEVTVSALSEFTKEIIMLSFHVLITTTTGQDSKNTEKQGINKKSVKIAIFGKEE